MFDSLESLEARKLFSVTLENGVLTVTGTEEPDQLIVGRNQAMIVVNDNGTASTWNPAEVMSIAVNGLGGNDTIGIMPGVFKPIVIDAGAGNDQVRGGPGRERILGGPGMDMLSGGGGGDLLEGGPDNDLIVGGPGEDRMYGNAGNDRFDAVDRNADFVDGGEGEDFARLCLGDRAVNVEHVQVVPPPAGVDAADAKVMGSDLLDEILA
ncbi:hypothetical protein BH09PLA1_BH09PLA1_06260 [soil metagenome]